jgi:hypothetical protein
MWLNLCCYARFFLLVVSEKDLNILERIGICSTRLDDHDVRHVSVQVIVSWGFEFNLPKFYPGWSCLVIIHDVTALELAPPFRYHYKRHYTMSA